MSKQLTFKGASEMPEIPISLGFMDWNKTGAWRAQRPYYLDKTPPCNASCPVGNDIVSFIQKIVEEDWDGAWRVLREENPFPGVCGRVCFHPCESRCNRSFLDEPIAIHALERFVADFSEGQGQKVKREVEKGKERIAIIGSGPAGLSCAYHLARLHYPVTVFESFPLPGGMLRMGIPSYRLPREVLEREISLIESMGVEIRTGITLSQNLTWQDLKDYSAIFLAIGAHLGRPLGIPGEKRRGVFQGLEFLKRVNSGRKIELGEKVGIIGGGNTAIDVARSVIRLGKKPILLYRRSKEEMPAFEEEVSEALEEGVKIRYLVNPIRIHSKDGLKRLECLRMKLGEKDETGRRKPIPIPNSNFFIEVDSLIIAAGEEIEFSYFPKGIERKGGILLTQRDGSTGVKGVFAGGDLTSTQRTVAHAIGSGKKAALAMDCYFKEKDSEEAFRRTLIGEGPSISIFRYLHPDERRMDSHLVRFEELNLDYFEPAPRQKESKLTPKVRVKDFKEITSTLPSSLAVEEAGRCFSCGTCNGCETCYLFCPDASILKREGVFLREIDYDFCKGCGVCFTECPRGAITLKEEAR
jgi:2-oxoacid:acceptor oxidoreductase delta subunit (pyruvate/2-ketoisovalerate family)